MRGNYQNTTSSAYRKPPRNLVFHNKNRTKTNEIVTQQDQENNEKPVELLEEIPRDNTVNAETHPKPVNSKPNPKQRRKNKLLKALETQEIEGNVESNMRGNYQNTTSSAYRKPPRNLVFHNKNRTKTNEIVTQQDQENNEKPVELLEEIPRDNTVNAETHPKPVNSKPNPKQRRKNKLLKALETQEIEGNVDSLTDENIAPAPPKDINDEEISATKKKLPGRRQRKKKNQPPSTFEENQTEGNNLVTDVSIAPAPNDCQDKVLSAPVKKQFSRRQGRKKHQPPNTVEENQPEGSNNFPTVAESAPEASAVDEHDDVDKVCKTMEQLQIRLTNGKSKIKQKRKTRNQKLKKPTQNKWPPQIDVFHVSLPNRKTVPEVAVELYRRCAIREEKNETDETEPYWQFDQPLNYLRNAVHVHPSEDQDQVIGMVVRNNSTEAIIRVEGILDDLENELRFICLTKHSTARIKTPHGENDNYYIPLDQHLIGSKIVIHEIETYHRAKDETKTAAQLFTNPNFHVTSFSPYGVLHDEIGLCVFSRKEEAKNENGKFFKWVEMEILGPSFRRPFQLNNLSCQVDDWENVNWDNWGHNFICCTMWRLPFCKTQCFEKDKILTLHDQDKVAMQQFEEKFAKYLESEENASKELFNINTDLSLVGVRLVTTNEFDLMQQNYKIPLNNVRQQELYIRDVYLSMSLLEEHVYSTEVRKRTLNTTVSGKILDRENRTTGLMHIQLNRDQHKRLFLESSTASWDKNLQLSISVLEHSELALQGFVIRDQYDDVGFYFDIELESKSVESWSRVLKSNPHLEVTIAPLKRRHDSTSEHLYKKFASLRHSEIHRKWVKCEGYPVAIEVPQIEHKPMAIKLDASQQSAVDYAVNRHGFSCITAATGTGKTLVTVVMRAEKYLNLTKDAGWTYVHTYIKLLGNPILQKAIEDVNLRVILRDPDLLKVLFDVRTRSNFNNDFIKKALENPDVTAVLRNTQLSAILFDSILRPVLADVDLMKILNDQKLQKIAETEEVRDVLVTYVSIREELQKPDLSENQIDKLLKKEEKAEIELKTVMLANFKPQVIIGTVDMLARHNFESETMIVEEGGQFLSASMLMLLECMRSLKQIILVGDDKLIGPFNVFRFDSHAQSLRAVSEMERVTQGSGADLTQLKYSYRAHPKLVKLQNLRYPELNTTVPRNMIYGASIVPKSAKGDPFAFISYPMIEAAKKTKEQCKVEIVQSILQKLAAQKVKPEDIVVLSYLRVHSRKLRETLKQAEVEVCTVDSFQGRESPVVIVLAALTQQKQFSDDIRRLTVAISRAREYLYIIGPQDLFELPSWTPFSEYAKSRGAFLNSMSLTPF